MVNSILADPAVFAEWVLFVPAILKVYSRHRKRTKLQQVVGKELHDLFDESQQYTFDPNTVENHLALAGVQLEKAEVETLFSMVYDNLQGGYFRHACRLRELDQVVELNKWIVNQRKVELSQLEGPRMDNNQIVKHALENMTKSKAHKRTIIVTA